MSRALFVLVALLAVGCMGDDDGGGDGAAESLHAFLVAVSEGDRPAADAQERVPRGVRIPPPEDFVVLKEGSVTVAATDLDTEFGAFAAPVRLEQGTWKVEPPRDATARAGAKATTPMW